MGFSMKEGLALIIRWFLKGHLKLLNPKSRAFIHFSCLKFPDTSNLLLLSQTPFYFFCNTGCSLFWENFSLISSPQWLCPSSFPPKSLKVWPRPAGMSTGWPQWGQTGCFCLSLACFLPSPLLRHVHDPVFSDPQNVAHHWTRWALGSIVGWWRSSVSFLILLFSGQLWLSNVEEPLCELTCGGEHSLWC